MNMDGEVSDFFNEINQIVPTKETNTDWQECYDEGSGYPYYWNMKTDKVMWDMPPGYKRSKNTGNRNVPPRPAPLFPSTAPIPQKYKLQKDQQNLKIKPNLISNDKGEKRTILIGSYNSDSDSDEEEKESRIVTKVKMESTTKQVLNQSLPPANSKSSSTSGSDKEDDTDLLTKIQNRAKVLTRLGGELPASVKKIVQHNGCNETENEKIKKQAKKDVTGFSLVAGYGESDEEEEASLPIKKPQSTLISSPLFPASKHIDLAQFDEVKKEPAPVALGSVDSKAFQRKRRIGLDFLDNSKKAKPDITTKQEVERLGLGFKNEKEDGPSNKNEAKQSYPGFKSGGLMFVKSDTAATGNPQPENKVTKGKPFKKKEYKYRPEELKQVEEAHRTLNEKLHFLAEGRELATPVQTMIIQLDTLHDAMKAKALSLDYLYKWLQDTCTELLKLEKGATPPGWILKWDRIVKRYYYRNQQSGDCQWDFPQPDIVGGNEAMDISTTPPPPPVVEEPPSSPPPLPSEPPSVVRFTVQPPPPPRIKSPTPPPPPPPTISKDVKQKPKGKPTKHTHLSPKRLPSKVEDIHIPGEPLPPGVDMPEPKPAPMEVPVPVPEVDALGSALNSFYSDLATMEAVVPVPPPVYIAPTIPTPVLSNIVPEKSVKKKKTKVKIVEGLAMKKKGVSKLVEKWKNVQKDY